MENLLNKITELVDAYNQLPNANKVAIVSEEYVKNKEIPIIEKKLDVSNMQVGVYDDNCVDLFDTIRYSSKIKKGPSGYEEYSAGQIYIGAYTTNTAIKITHHECFESSDWQKIGSAEIVDEKRYVCTCNMHATLPFETMRLMMYEEGLITEPYEIGKASKKEIVEVLKYAYSYYKGKLIVAPQKNK